MGRRQQKRHLPVPASRRDRDITRVTARMQTAAALEAQGLTPAEIQTATDGNISAGYVRDLHMKQGYKNLVEAAVKEKGAIFVRVLANLKADVADLAREMLPLIREMAVATDTEGRPLWSVRREALKLAMDNPALKAALGAALTGDEDDGGKTVVGIPIHVHIGEQHLHEAPSQDTVIEYPLDQLPEG